MTATMPDSLPMHRAVMQAAGPDALLGIIRPLTDGERTVLDDWYAKARRMSLEELAAHAGIPVADAAELRDVLELDS